MHIAPRLPSVPFGRCEGMALQGSAKSYAAMKAAGWEMSADVIDATHGNIKKSCGNGANWFGWSHGNAVGSISRTLQGDGTVELDFGNCWKHGDVVVSLDGPTNAPHRPPSPMLHPRVCPASCPSATSWVLYAALTPGGERIPRPACATVHASRV